MKNLLLTLSVLVTVALTSCRKEINGSGHYVDQSRIVGEFHEIESSGDFNVVLVPDSNYHVELHGEDNIIPELKTIVSGDRLKIYFDHSNCHYDYNDLTITLYAPSFTDIYLLGSGKISNRDTLFSNMDVNLSGSGEIDLTMNNAEMNSRITGSGKITLNGSSRNAWYSITGSGNIHAFDLVISSVTVDIAGSGNCSVNATDYLDVTISGSGTVFYLGNPEVHTSVSGSGSVIPE